MSRLSWHVLALVVAVVVLLALFPPFRVVRLGPDGKYARVDAAPPAFDPSAFAVRFWSEKLQPAAARAPELAPITIDLRVDPTEATRRHGRKVGEGTTWYYFARGSGRITAVEKSRVLVELDDAPGAIVALRTGSVFGNAVRDGCGLLELNEVPGLAEFNALSAEINRLVEERVLPALRESAAADARVTFAGCAEAPESVPAGGALFTIIPVQVEVTP